MSAAAVFFHRFYMRYSFVDYHRFETAATCLFLAGKVEENGRKLKDVADAVIIKLYRSSSGSQSTLDLLKQHEREVQRFQHLITVYELLLADALAFDIEVSHVQGVLVIALDELVAPEDVGDMSWTIANDALYTPLCVLHTPNVIAAACYLLALALLKQPDLPWQDYLSTAPSPRPEQEKWKTAFSLSSPSDLTAVRDSIAVLLEFWHSLDDDTRRQFNTKLEDIPGHLSGLVAPEDGRTLASYAPPPSTSPHANGTNGKAWTVVGGEGTPWQSQSGSGTPWLEGGRTTPSTAFTASQSLSERGNGTAETVTPVGRSSPWQVTPPSA